MPTRSRIDLYVHFAWATRSREPLITRDRANRIRACIASSCAALGCKAIAIGGMADHVHVLVKIGAMACVSSLAMRMKGSSSHLVNHELAPGATFRWQGGYGAFSVSPDRVEVVRAYIRGQARHHRAGSAIDDWEPDADTDGEDDANDDTEVARDDGADANDNTNAAMG